MANYDILGNIAIIKFPDGMKKEEKLIEANKMLMIPSVKTVLEKAENVRGRLRTIKVRHLAGKRNLIAVCRENARVFRLNVEKCYFSSRLANERLEVARMIKKGDRVLVMFSGVAPFPIVIAKFAKPKKIIAVELGRECHKYALENLKLNKIYSGIELIQGDAKRIIRKGGLIAKGNFIPLQFDVIVMPRPNLKETFLKEAFAVSKKGTRIIYYGFCHEEDLEDMLDEIKKEAEKYRRRIKILRVKEAGDIAPYKHRYRIEMKVL